MKTLKTLCLGSLALVTVAFGQNPTPPFTASPFPSASISATASASVSPSDENDDLASRIHKKIERNIKRHHGISIETDDIGRSGSDEIPAQVIPLVGIVFMTIFGAPVLIVGIIMYAAFSRNRMMHKTVRMMVEKGQPVPAALLAPPTPAVRQRSDMRRGVVLTMIGVGLMVWLGAVNDWEGGVWSFGLIPFLIGVGYLLVWKFEGGRNGKADNPPPLP